MKNFKIKYLDLNSEVIKSVIKKGKSKFDIEQFAKDDTENMPLDTFYIIVVEM